jgi:hypothetical protein
MSPSGPTPVAQERISLDDLKHRAEEIRDLAVTETKSAVTRVAQMDATKKAMIVAGVAVAVISIAFLMGARAGSRTRGLD